MKLLPDWRQVLSRAWSLRLIEAAAAADIILNIVPSMADFMPWWVTAALLVAAWGARLLAQSEKEAPNANQ
jgi:hypothetical protein